MSAYKSENELLQAIASLPREVAPENDVWPRIAGRIGTPEQPGESPAQKNRWWSAAIAASVLAVLASAVLFKQPPENGLPAYAVSGQPSEAAPDERPATSFQGLLLLSGSNTLEEQEYQAAFREFLAVLPDPQSSPWPGNETMESGWLALQQAEMELATALRQQPENPVLNSRMAALRARQLDLLQQIAAMEMLSRRTTT